VKVVKLTQPSRINNVRVVLIHLDFMEINRHNDTVEDRLTVWPAAIDSAQFKKAVNNVMNPNDRMSAYPPSTVASPYLFKRVAVPGICVE
jgi:hypothetical protein